MTRLSTAASGFVPLGVATDRGRDISHQCAVASCMIFSQGLLAAGSRSYWKPCREARNEVIDGREALSDKGVSLVA
jgi:hypothetical protein